MGEKYEWIDYGVRHGSFSQGMGTQIRNYLLEKDKLLAQKDERIAELEKGLEVNHDRAEGIILAREKTIARMRKEHCCCIFEHGEREGDLKLVESCKYHADELATLQAKLDRAVTLIESFTKNTGLHIDFVMDIDDIFGDVIPAIHAWLEGKE